LGINLRLISLPFLLIGLACLSLACQGRPPTGTLAATNAPANTPRPSVSPTLAPSETPLPSPSPTSPPVPSQTPTFIPSPTPTEMPWSEHVILLENAGLVRQLAQWGKGIVQGVSYGAQNQVVILETPFGLYLYQAAPLEPISFLGDVHTYRLSPDGNTLVAAYAGIGTVKAWSLETGDLLHVLEHEATPPRFPPAWFSLEEFLGVRAMAFSHDGQMLAISYGDNQVAVWSTNPWGPRMLLTSNVAPGADEIAFGRDNEHLATSFGGRVGIWRLSDGELLYRMPGAGGISEDPFSPDGKLIATSFDGRILVWNFPGDTLLYSYGFSGWPEVAFSVDSQYLIVDGVQVRKLADGTRLTPDKEQAILQAEGKAVTASQTALAVDETVFVQQNHYRGLQGISLTAGDGLLAWGVEDETVIFWRDLASGQAAQAELGSSALSRAFVSSGRDILAICLSKELHLFSISDESRQSLPGCKASGYLAFLDEKTLARASSTLIDIINLETGVIEHNLRGHTNEVTAMAISQDGSLLASGTRVSNRGAELFLWKLGETFSIWQEWKITSAVKFAETAIQSLAFSPDGALLAVAGADQNMKLYRVGDGWQLKIMKVEQSAVSLAFSPDGKLLAGGDQSGDVYLWSVPDGHVLSVLKAHRGAVVDLIFSGDGKALITASEDGTVRLWGVP